MKKYGLDSGEIHFSANEEIPFSGTEARLERGWQSRCRPLLGPLPWPLLPWLATSSAAGTQSYCSTISLKTCCREVEDEDKEEEFESIAKSLGIDIDRIAQSMLECDSPLGKR